MQGVTPLCISCFALVCSTLLRVSDAQLQLPFVNKFSQKGREQFSGNREDWPIPDPSSIDYHKLLYHNDAVRHGKVDRRLGERSLVESSEVYSFAAGNLTEQFGTLYVAVVAVGTPAVEFVVILDTGSDLFWLPCECQSCAPTNGTLYGRNTDFNVYTPIDSSTSRALACSSAECISNDFSTGECPSSSSECLYRASYVQTNTSTSGWLVEDVLHLTLNNGSGSNISVPVVLGCGQIQTGGFLDGSVPGGLIGLGLQKSSVPSFLGGAGIRDSFSMCFGGDGGTVMFGDLGSSSQQKTPIVGSQLGMPPMYNVGLQSIAIENGTTIPIEDSALWDTGTSFTYLNTSIYRPFIDELAAIISLDYQRVPVGSPSIGPFELCFYTTTTDVRLPRFSYSLSGDATFTVKRPYILLSESEVFTICLGLLESTDINIIGANFMLNQNIVFNRVDMTIGFEVTDCNTYVPNSGAFTDTAPNPKRAPESLGSPAPVAVGSSQASEASVTSHSLVWLLSLGLVQFLFH